MTAAAVLPVEKLRKKTPRYRGPRHVLKLPLETNPRDESILDSRLQVAQKLKNDVRGLLLKRADGMRNDPRWRAARRMPKRTEGQMLDRQVAYDALWAEYRLTREDAARLGEQVRNQRGWMRDILTVQLANKAGLEVYANVKAWLYGTKGRPRFRASAAPSTIWANQVDNGLVVRDGYLYWHALTKSKRKSLRLAIDYTGLTSARRAHLDSLEVQRYGLSREIVRGRWRYFLQVSLKGVAYRNPDYLATVDHGGLVGIDPGISYMALVSGEDSEVLPLISERELKKARGRARHRRRQQRKLDRSRRALNPDCYDEQGRSIKGRRPKRLGKQARRLQQRLATEDRRDALNRRAKSHTTAHALMRRGAHLAVETNSFRAFQRLWGKRMGLTAPGQFLAIVTAEARRVGGSVVPLDARVHCLSQFCLCGARRKKERSETLHYCTSCGLGPLDRNLFSAFLARLVVREGWLDLQDSSEMALKLAGLSGYREEAERLCSIEPPATPRSAISLDDTQALYGSAASSGVAGGLAGEPACQTPRECPADPVLQDTSRPAAAYPKPAWESIPMRGS